MSVVKETWARLRALFRKDDLDREFDDEAAAHIAMATEDYVQCGMPLAEAQRLARLKFGSVAASKDAHRDSRGVPSLEGFLFDLRLALRGLRRDRAFTLAAVTTLAIAIGLNATVFTIMNAMLFRGLPLATRSHRLAYLGMRRPTDLPCCPGPVSYADLEVWRSQASAFTGLAMTSGLGRVPFRDAASMVNLDLAAPSTAFCPIPTIFISFRGPPGPAPSSCGNRPVR